MTRRVLNLLAALSLLMCIATVVVMFTGCAVGDVWVIAPGESAGVVGMRPHGQRVPPRPGPEAFESGRPEGEVTTGRATPAPRPAWTLALGRIVLTFHRTEDQRLIFAARRSRGRTTTGRAALAAWLRREATRQPVPSARRRRCLRTIHRRLYSLTPPIPRTEVGPAGGDPPACLRTMPAGKRV